MTHEAYLEGFKVIIQEMYELTAAKNADYADADDAFANFRLVEDLGVVKTEEGIVVRMSDKFKRLTNLLHREGQVKDEGLEDTLKDLSVYSILLLLYLRSIKEPVDKSL